MIRRPSVIHSDMDLLDRLEQEARDCHVIREPAAYSPPRPPHPSGGPISPRRPRPPSVGPDQLLSLLRKLATAVRKVESEEDVELVVSAFAESIASRL